MAEEIRLVVKYKDKEKNLLWISLQDDGSVSVGLLGQTLVFDAFTSERELEDGARQFRQTDLRSTHSMAAMRDPHFTLHPGGYFHLRSRNHPPLVAGLVWTIPEPSAITSPWIRFISDPVKDLSSPQPLQPTRKTTIQTLLVESDECSIAVNFDFVDERAAQLPLVKDRKANVIRWHNVSVMVYAYPIAPQKATLGYLIRG